MQIECLNSTAHLDPAAEQGQGARLILVRHGETNWNRDGRFQGQIDIPLNSNGHAQAEAARGFLADVPIQKAISSSMTRPRETAEGSRNPIPASPWSKPTVSSKSAMASGKEAGIGNQAEWGALLEEWKRTPETVQMPEGKPFRMSGRSVQSWNTIANDLTAETALVVAHDAVNKTILCHLLGLTPADIWAVKQGKEVSRWSTCPQNGPACSSGLPESHLPPGGVLDRTAAGAL